VAAKFTMPTRLVLIEWLDAMSDDAGWKPWKRVAKQEPVLVHSVGYVVSDVPAFMTLAGSVVAIDGTCDGDVTIPRSMIQRIHELQAVSRPKENPSDAP
jgi:hypothetical protein